MMIYSKEKLTEPAKWIFSLFLSYVIYFVFSLFIPNKDTVITAILANALLCSIFLLLSRHFLSFNVKKYFNLNLEKFSFKKFFISLFVSIFILVFSSFLRMKIRGSLFVHSSFNMSIYQTVKTCILIAVASLTEELLFRAYIGNFCNRTAEKQNYWKYCLCSGFLFAAAHFQNPEMYEYGIQAFVFYLVFGCLLMLFYLSDKSIEFVLGVHIANNLTACFLFSYPQAVLDTKALFTAPFSLFQGLLEIFLITVFFFLVFKKLFRFTETKTRNKQ